MTIYRNSKYYRSVWEEYHKQKIPDGYQIHHIDGNHQNNSIENLICVSSYVHWCIHHLQGDNFSFIKNSHLAAKMGAAASAKKSKGQKRGPMSEETKKKISAKLKGVPKSDEHIKASSQAHKALNRKYKCSEETKKILSIRADEHWKRQKLKKL